MVHILLGHPQKSMRDHVFVHGLWSLCQIIELSLIQLIADHLPVHFHFAVDGNVIHNMGSYVKKQFMNIDGIQ